MGKEAQILRIERLSPNDGQGLRTVIFFKGCPMKCRWCSTPESQLMKEQLYYEKSKCVFCGKCVEVCKKHALTWNPAAKELQYQKNLCRLCRECVRVCPRSARGVYGQKMSVEQVMCQIRKDEVFYFHSKGGVTLSGGDVLMQADFASELLAQCREEGIHTMAELNMFGEYGKIAMLLPHLNAFYADIKLMNSEAHKYWTGVDNHTILENIQRASKECRKDALHVRVPLIRGVNFTRENIRDTLDFCRTLENCPEVEFLPYHRLGLAAYERIGREYELADLPAMQTEEVMEQLAFVQDEEYPFQIKVSGRAVRKEQKGEHL